jgi:xylulokinase
VRTRQWDLQLLRDIDPGGRLQAALPAGRWLPLICTMNLTNATESIRARFDLDIERFNALLAQAPIGAEGVCMPITQNVAA